MDDSERFAEAFVELDCGHVHTVVFPFGTPVETMIAISAGLAVDPPECGICAKRRAIAAQN